MKELEMYDICSKYDMVMKTREINDIPYFNFNPEWNIKIIPPFSGASVRFTVEKGNKRASIYLDRFENLGYYGENYREVCLYIDEENTEIERFHQKNSLSLLEYIDKYLSDNK